MMQLQEQQYQSHNMPLYYPNSMCHTNSVNSVKSTESQTSSFLSDSASTSNSSISTTNSSKSTPTLGVNLRVTGQCSQGGRKYMEDYFSVAYQQSDNAKDLEYAFIGIYDGHGGAEAAAFAKQHLMMEIINQKLFWSDSDQDVLRAIREGYVATHYAMWREQEKWPKTANGLPSTAGTTATIAFIRREKIYIGHVGDSAIVLGYQNENENFWRAKQLTTDHKPESQAERTRINRSGGKVIVKSGVPRVVWNRPRNAMHKGPIRRNTPVDEIPFLAVARSLGDLWSYNSARNEFIVSPDPDVSVIRIDPKSFRCLIFGTDGLWNVVTAKDAVDTVYAKERINQKLKLQMNSAEDVQWTNPSKSLVEKALRTWSSKKMRADNTSVVTVLLYPASNSEIIEPNSVPSSYGTEYTELDAEIPSFDDTTTFHEISEKYLPPEEYRNFNYYDDEEDLKSIEENFKPDPMVFKYNRPDLINWRNTYNKIEETKCYADDNNSWQWYADSNKKYDNHVKNCNNPNNAYEDHEDMNSDDMIENEISVSDYPRYIADTSNSIRSNISAEAHETNGYMNSFAESYNSLLSDQITEDANTSNSNASYQSVTGTNMNDILQEQQLYQQQCMSDEDGYSLTKLETRGEQQRSGDVQTFKIFQQHNAALNSNNYEQQPAQETNEETSYWDMRYQSLPNNVNRYSMYPQQTQQQKLLELNSVLQQEREEEQQVALERMQLQRKMDNSSLSSNSNSYHCLQPVSPEETLEDSLFEEYLEDDHEDSVQINEITSSIDISDDEVNSRKDVEALLEMSNEKTFNADLMYPIFEKLEKIEILCKKPDVITEATYKHMTHKNTHLSSNKPRDTYNTTIKPLLPTHYRNVPNENQNLSITASTHPLHKTKRYVHSAPVKPEPVSSTPEKRQLRSSGIRDYCKRTLRTRNSLTKDMKAKPTVSTSIKRNLGNTTPYVRSTAANMQENAKNLNDRHHPVKPSTSKPSIHYTHSPQFINNCSTTKGRKPDANKHSMLTASAVNAAMSHVINLRSRVINQIVGNTMMSPNAGFSSTPSPRHEQRNLRSLNTRNSTRESSNSSTTNYSKSSRMQSTLNALASTPPTPKLINATTVVLAATRARSMLSQKNATVSNVFTKRSSLRSSTGSSTSLNGGNNQYLVTRSRAARKLKR
ncbi:uncharacterized protein LOC119670108 [Teleopsis dalmanni]|uniref:uncharacterized protein LOC119670108 n=1 Tax=Teleopsis dalmanni TaxID=139649 RepID=UPI0018CEF713|nr:uncharacterized protein LOC119670108 [Teleopsis dalmanni]